MNLHFKCRSHRDSKHGLVRTLSNLILHVRPQLPQLPTGEELVDAARYLEELEFQRVGTHAKPETFFGLETKMQYLGLLTWNFPSRCNGCS